MRRNMFPTVIQRSYYRAPGRGVAKMQYTAAEILDIRGSLNPDQEAIVVLDIDSPRQAITFGELKTKTEHLAAGMIRAGLNTGDRVALLCPTSLDYVLCEYAMVRTGAILVHFPVGVNSGAAVKYLLKQAGCRWLITHPGEKDGLYCMVEEAIPGLANHDPTAKLRMQDLPDFESVFVISSKSYPGCALFSAFSADITEADLLAIRKRQSSVDLDMPMQSYCTSGSTGYPKCALLPGYQAHHGKIIKNVGVNATDRTLTDRPMSYEGGSTMAIIGIGCTFCAVKTKLSGPEAQRGIDFYFKCIQNESITALLVLPYVLKEFISRICRGMDIRKIKCCITSGQVFQKEVFKECLDLGVPMINCYGASEIGAIASTKLDDPMDVKIGKTGHCFCGEVKVIDDEGVVVPVGTAGEVCVRKRKMLLGYLGDPETTKQAIDSRGWFHTNDIGVMDENGYLEIHGRATELISKATVKIYPAAIEKLVCSHPKVNGVVACGIPHPIINEEICICIVEEEGSGLTADEVRTFCKKIFTSTADETRSTLAPDYMLLFAKFPLGRTDKTDRKQVRQEAIRRVEADRERSRV